MTQDESMTQEELVAWLKVHVRSWVEYDAPVVDFAGLAEDLLAAGWRPPLITGGCARECTPLSCQRCGS